ncbi:MAG: hypothetical protein JST54_32875 [Deltaproteobacteria bacterium]|nr:hypothetical protein [Deltaproteobacteria bacterium]
MHTLGWKVCVVLALVGASGLARGDEPAPLPPAPQATELVAGLLVVTASGVTYEDGVLSLLGVGATTVIVAERPDRVVGHMLTRDAARTWSQGPNAFEIEPPFGTLSTFLPDGTASEVVLELNHPKLVGDTLSFDARVVRGSAPCNGGASTLFIGAVDMPLSKLSNPGVPKFTTPGAAFYSR